MAVRLCCRKTAKNIFQNVGYVDSWYYVDVFTRRTVV